MIQKHIPALPIRLKSLFDEQTEIDDIVHDVELRFKIMILESCSLGRTTRKKLKPPDNLVVYLYTLNVCGKQGKQSNLRKRIEVFK